MTQAHPCIKKVHDPARGGLDTTGCWECAVLLCYKGPRALLQRLGCASWFCCILFLKSLPPAARMGWIPGLSTTRWPVYHEEGTVMGHAAWLPVSTGLMPTEHEAEELGVHVSQAHQCTYPPLPSLFPTEKTDVHEKRQHLSQTSLWSHQGELER